MEGQPLNSGVLMIMIIIIIIIITIIIIIIIVIIKNIIDGKIFIFSTLLLCATNIPFSDVKVMPTCQKEKYIFWTWSNLYNPLMYEEDRSVLCLKFNPLICAPLLNINWWAC